MSENWKQTILERKSVVNGLYREIAAIEKKIKHIGTTNSLEYIAEQIELRYNIPCRIRKCGVNHKRIVLYKSTASKKQIQYDRDEATIGSVVVFDNGDTLYEVTGKYSMVQLPDTISGVYDLLVNNKHD